MEKLTSLINEIQDCTLEIEVHYPELYKRLDQTPYQNMFSRVSTETLQDYLSVLKTTLETVNKPICNELSKSNY